MRNVHLAVGVAAMCAIAVALSAQSTPITIVLTGQSMLRSDLRATKPAAVPVDQRAAERRRDVHEPRSRSRRTGRDDSGGPRVSHAAGSARRADGHGLQPAGAVRQPRLRSEGDRHPEYTPRDRPPEDRSRRHGQQHRRSGSSRVPANTQGDGRADRERLRIDCTGRTRHRGTPRRQRASRASGRSRERGDRGFARGAGQHTESGRCTPHSAKHSRRPPARGHRDRVPAQSRVRRIARSRRSSPKGCPSGSRRTRG